MLIIKIILSGLHIKKKNITKQLDFFYWLDTKYECLNFF
jgi:hypothetical protein